MRFWVAGRLVAEDEARVGVLDHGFTVGDGVFETLKTAVAPGTGVVPFAMDRHVERLCASADGLGLAAPDTEEVRTAMLAVCAANPGLADRGRIRVTYSSGPGPLGSDRGGGTGTLTVTAAPAPAWPATTRVALSPWPRNERSPLVGVKSTSYAENVVALAHAKSVGAGEALLVNLAGNVCEGTGSNVFVVIDGQVVTPPLTSGCLAGITRALVLQWCADAGIPAVEGDLTVAEALRAQEAFITSSTRDVHPVEALLDDAGAVLWHEPVGPRTRAVAQAFAERAGADWNP